MHTPESQIKAALLHPEEEIRLWAVDYFAEARYDDDSIMPLVIQSVEKFGRETAFDILHRGMRLPQTEATVDWLIRELWREYDPRDVWQENYPFVLAWVLSNIPQPLLRQRFDDIITAPAFPEQLRHWFSVRLDMFALEDWDRAWTALKHFVRETMRSGRNHLTSVWGAAIIESLARHAEKAKTVLSLLEGQGGDDDPCVNCWLQPSFMDLAAAMRLTEAVPPLMDHLNKIHGCSAGQALARIGGNVVLREIDARWRRRRNGQFRRAAVEILQRLRGDDCIERSLAFFREEKHWRIKSDLASVLLASFSEEAIGPIGKFIADVGEKKFQYGDPDLRYHLVATCMIMGKTLPQFKRWRKAALGDNWGRLPWPPTRLANTYNREKVTPKWRVD